MWLGKQEETDEHLLHSHQDSSIWTDDQRLSG